MDLTRLNYRPGRRPSVCCRQYIAKRGPRGPVYTDGPFESNEPRGPTHSLSGHTRPLPIIALRVGNFVSIYRPAAEKASPTATRELQGVAGRQSARGEVAIMKRRSLLPATSSRKVYTVVVLKACPRLPEMTVPTDYQSNRMFVAKGLLQFSFSLSLSVGF